MAFLFLCCALALRGQDGSEKIFNGQGLLAGDVTETSAVLLARFTATEALINDDVPGARAIACFEVSDNELFKDSIRTEWTECNSTNDYLLKAHVSGLKPGTLYLYRVWFGLHPRLAQTDVARAFKTLGGAQSAGTVSFAVLGSLNRAAYLNAGVAAGEQQTLREKLVGYPAFHTLYRLRPDFFVTVGNVVQYDAPASTQSANLAALRRAWHRQFIMPRLAHFLSIVPGFWLQNESANTGNGKPSAEMMDQLFTEQTPMADSGEPLRTRRVNRFLQAWFLEPQPQAEWMGMDSKTAARFRKTVKDSDAPFLVLFVAGRLSSTAKEQLFTWLKNNRISPGRFLLVTDGRQLLHLRHAAGYDEFVGGTLHLENAVTAPEDVPPSAKGLFAPPKPLAGFFYVTLRPADTGRRAVMRWVCHDSSGTVLYQAEKDSALP